MIIYLDFDGTVVEHNYPEIGAYNEGCFEVIKKLQQAGHQIILNTYRSNVHDGTLEEALYFLHRNNHHLHQPISERTNHKLEPEVWGSDTVSESNILFIDDLSEGIPLKDTVELPQSKMVDWRKVDDILEKNGLYR